MKNNLSGVINFIKDIKFTVYSNSPINESCECFGSNKQIGNDLYFVKSVPLKHIKHCDGRFYYTDEDLSIYDDFFGKHALPVIGAFVSGSKSKHKHKLSNKFITDISGLPAFNVTAVANEDVKMHEYRLYITLFNDYSLKECQYERHDLHDLAVTSSKFDLENKLQNSDFLRSKDFTVINVRRKEFEDVTVGLIVREPENGEILNECGSVTIDMNNKISVKWF